VKIEKIALYNFPNVNNTIIFLLYFTTFLFTFIIWKKVVFKAQSIVVTLK